MSSDPTAMASENNTQPPPPPRPTYPSYSWRNHSSNGKLVYIRDHHIANAELANLPKGPLGFDLEWRPNFRKGEKENPVALVQLANQDTVWLIQVSAMIEFPATLKDILGSDEWVKAGVGIQNDCIKLYRNFSVSTQNCVDLSLLARTTDNVHWKGKYTNPIGLSHLLETYENFFLPKGKVQRSNWELLLSDVQQEYAANDAHAGYMLYTRLSAMAHNMENIPSVRYYSFSIINGALRDLDGFKMWRAENPFYDPGPPPPPREPKESKKPKIPKANNVTATVATVSAPTASRTTPTVSASSHTYNYRQGARNRPLLESRPSTWRGVATPGGTAGQRVDQVRYRSNYPPRPYVAPANRRSVAEDEPSPDQSTNPGSQRRRTGRRANANRTYSSHPSNQRHFPA